MANYYTYGQIPSGFAEPTSGILGENPTIGSFFQPGLTLPSDIDPNKPMSSLDPLAGQRAMALASLIDPAALAGFSAFSADPNVAAGAFRRSDTRAGFGSAGSMYEEGALEAAKAAALADPTQGLWGEGFKSLIAEDPQTQAAIEAMQQRNVSGLARYEQNFPVMQQLSKLLKENKFNEAFAFARENNVLDALMSTESLRELRPAFTQAEMKSFFEAIPRDYAGSEFEYKPDVGYKQSVDPFSTGISMELGYPDPTGAFKRKDDKTVENLVKAAALAMIAGTYGPGLFGGSSAAAPAATGAGATGAGAAGTAAGATGAGTLTAAELASILPEVVITASKPALASLLAPAAVGTVGLSQLAGGATAPASTAPVTQPTVEPPLEEVVVQSTAPSTGAGLVGPVIGAGTAAGALGGTPPPPEPVVEPLEEVVVQSQRPVADAETVAAGLGTAAAAESALSQAQQAREPTYEEPPMEEVVVQTTKPELPLSEVITGGLAAADLADVSKVVDVQKELGYEPVKIEETPLQKLQSFADKVGGINNALRILGGLGGLLSGTQKPVAAAPAASPQGFGGALPKYEISRQQLRPDIDYYRYGLGPEARFFEDRMTKVEPAPAPAPATGMVNPEEQPVFAEGGLAKGGRYIEGAGSGRDDKIPALLSDGEYVIDAETLALLGDGSTKEGAKRMDEFRAKIRKHKGRALSRGRISPDAKSPSKYMGGGLT